LRLAPEQDPNAGKVGFVVKHTGFDGVPETVKTHPFTNPFTGVDPAQEKFRPFSGAGIGVGHVAPVIL
jgi:hypothetical protein